MADADIETQDGEETFEVNEEGVAYSSESAPERRHPRQAGDHRPGRGHRPSQGGRRPRADRARQRQVDRERS